MNCSCGSLWNLAANTVAQIVRAGRKAQAHIDAALGAVGLSYVKWRALDILANADSSLPQTLIAVKMDCCKSNITQITDKLEAEGLIVRTLHPSDRRTTLVEITEHGRDMQKQGRATILAAASEFTAPLADNNREILDGLLEDLVGPSDSCSSTDCQSGER